MNIELYSEVASTQNIAKHSLKIGDVATLVDFVTHPSPRWRRRARAVGESIGVVTVPISAIKSLSANDILTARPLEQAS